MEELNYKAIINTFVELLKLVACFRSKNRYFKGGIQLFCYHKMTKI